MGPTRSSLPNADEMTKHAGSFDFILDCVSAEHDINAYLNLLKPTATSPWSVRPRSRCRSRPSASSSDDALSGSLIGGIAETQEMLDFCGEHNITADVEVIPIQQINEAYERMLKPT